MTTFRCTYTPKGERVELGQDLSKRPCEYIDAEDTDAAWHAYVAIVGNDYPAYQIDEVKTYQGLILGYITADGYDGREPETDAERLAFINETFAAEYGWAVARMGKAAALREWLMGLPSSMMGMPFYNHDMLKLAVKMGGLKADATEQAQDKSLENYWQFMASKSFGMLAKI